MNRTAGTTLHEGKYVLKLPLGQPRGSTFRALQIDLNKPVVLKIFQPNRAIKLDEVELRQQFVETMSRLTQCRHANLVNILDLFEEAGIPVAVMDEVVGRSLSEQVQQEGPLSEAEAIRYIQKVASAVDLLHRHHVVHQDIKPANLIVPTGSDHIVLVDYGLVRQTLPREGDRPAVGLPEPYAAIEQYTEPPASLTPATDVYGLAASLYFLVTGQPPIPACFRHQLPLRTPRQLQPALNPVLEAAILRGMEVNPRTRPQSIAAWVAHLPHLSQTFQNTPATIEVLPEVLPEQSPTQPQTVLQAHTQLLSSQPNGSQPNGAVPTLPPVRTTPHPNQGKHRIVGRRQSRKPIVLVSIIAAAVGLGGGLALRMGGATGPGSTIFHAEQAFPPASQWPGSSTPASSDDAPIEARPSQPDALSPAKPIEVAPPEEPFPEPPPRRSRIADPAPVVTPTPVPSPVTEEPAIVPATPTPVAPTPIPSPLLPRSQPTPASQPSPAPVAPAPALEPAPPPQPAPVPIAPPPASKPKSEE